MCRLPILLLLFSSLLSAPSHAERADRSKPVSLEADSVKVDERNQVQTFEGDVRLTQGTLEIRAERMLVTQDKQGFQRGVAQGKGERQAWFKQKREARAEFIEGQADRIEHDSQNERTDFFGNARVKSGKDEVTGPHIRYDGRTETYLVNGRSGDVLPDQAGGGRVRVVIQPKNEN
jgi:lipopolysaccharide export system protein LptA